MATISIIVTTYNIEQYVDQCLHSVAAQSLSDIEVLVVDDGSSDSTPDKINAFCSGDPRFVPVLLTENSPGGVATAANAGLDQVTSPWVGFVDGDDFIEPTMFERLLEAATTHDADLSMCQYQEFDDATGERKNPADANRWADLDRDVYRLDAENSKAFLRFIAVPWRKLYRRDLLEENAIRFPVGDYFYEDNPFHWFSVLSADSIAPVPAVLCYHRMGRAGQTMGTADSRLFQIFQHHNTIHTWLTERRLLDAYATTLLAWVISQMEWISRRTPAHLQRELFDVLAPIFGQYSTETVQAALRESSKGVTAQRLSMAVAKGEYGTFRRALSTRPDTSNPVITAAYHLRHTGAKHTAVLTGRYVRNRFGGMRSGRTISRVVGDARRTRPGGTDSMFAFMVVQRQLNDIRDRLADVQDRLSRVEEHMESTHAQSPDDVTHSDVLHSDDVLQSDEGGPNVRADRLTADR